MLLQQALYINIRDLVLIFFCTYVVKTIISVIKITTIIPYNHPPWTKIYGVASTPDPIQLLNKFMDAIANDDFYRLSF